MSQLKLNLSVAKLAIATRIEQILSGSKGAKPRDGWLLITADQRKPVLDECLRCVMQSHSSKLKNAREWANKAIDLFRMDNPTFERRADAVIDNRLTTISWTISSMCFNPETFDCFF